MSADNEVWVAVLAMAAATYATRFGGLLLGRLAPSTPLLEAWLSQVPGAMFVALIVTSLVQGGTAAWVGAAAALVAARLSGGVVAAVIAGVAVTAGLRWAMGG